MNQLMHAVAPWVELTSANLWRASWQGAIAIAAAWAVARWCTFLSPRVVCWVWRLACLKLLVALLWIQPLAIAILPAKFSPIVAASDGLSARPAARAALETVVATPEADLQTRAAATADPQPNLVTPSTWLLALWLAGVGCGVAVTARQWRLVRGLRRAAEPTSSALLWQSCRQEAERLGVQRLPQLQITSQAESPLLAGILRPAIILPHSALHVFDAAELRVMLAHELGHLKRHDLLWNCLPTVVGWLFFFHPLVWVLMRRWSEAQEAACDELLIQNQVARPAQYGRLLLKLATHWPREPRSSLVAAGVLGAYRNLERRILAMAQVKPLSVRRLTAAAGAVMLTATIGIIPWRLAAQEIKNGPEHKPPAKAADAKKPKASAADKPADTGSDMLRDIRRASAPLLASMAKDHGYGLAAGENVKRVAPPYPAIRMEYYRIGHPGQADLMPAGPEAMFFRFQKGQLEYRGMMFGSGDGDSVGALLNSIAQLKPQMVQGSEELLNKRVPGDWVYRKGLTSEEGVRALEKILQTELSLPIKMEFRQAELPVYVVRGTYQHKSLPGQPAKEKLHLTDETIETDSVEIFGKQLVPNSGSGGGTGTYREFLDWLGNWISTPIISEVESPPKNQISWRLHGQSPQTAQTRDEDHAPQLVLPNIAAQTGLTFSQEVRPVKILFVEASE